MISTGASLTGPALYALRRQGQYLARRYLVQFVDRTDQSIVLPEPPALTAPASRPIGVRARSDTENAVRKRARAMGFYVRKSKAPHHGDGGRPAEVHARRDNDRQRRHGYALRRAT